MATGLAAANGKQLLVLGANVVGQCLDAGLVDELWIHLAPVILGDGVPLFRAPSHQQIKLETITVVHTDAVTDLRFKVSK